MSNVTTRFSSLAIQAGDNCQLDLVSCGAAWCPSQQSLFVADLHLGKETTFQRSSIAVPHGATERTLENLERLIEYYHPQQVYILGDLVHARSSFSAAMREVVEGFWDRQSSKTIRWILIEGNHDRHSLALLSEWPLEIFKAPYQVECLRLLHDFSREGSSSSSSDPSQKPFGFTIAGHIHPGIRMPDNGQRLRVFDLRQNVLTLPSFGFFTGLKIVDQELNCRTFAIDGRSIIELPSAH